MKKFRFLITGLLLFAVLLGACQAQEPAPAAEEPSAEEPVMEETKEPFRVAVVMPSAINDLAFSQSMYDALLTIQSEMGGEEAMEIVYSDGMFVVDDAAAAIRDYAA